jgi:hypothetical protein
MRRSRLAVPIVLALLASAAVPGQSTRSLAFFLNDPNDYDHGRQLVLPPGFGAGPFTLELWIRPDESFPVGPTTSGAGQRTNWSDADHEPYSSCCWWYEGNFLLDGHNNGDFSEGTFSLQFYGGGRLRWLVGDGGSPGEGDVRSVGAYPASSTASLLDGNWHRVALVRRWTGTSGARLELWLDGARVATETTPLRTDLTAWWGDWSAFPAGQEGWFWGAEKQAAIGVLPQYEDYKGPLDELRFFARALAPAELAAGACAAFGAVGRFAIEEGAGNSTCDGLDSGRCIALVDMKPGFWSTASAPPCASPFASGFETADFAGWSSTVP